MNKMVSIIVPVYNAASYLNGCIDSILSQDYTDIELILVNDGSTDNSDMICLQYKERDSRVIYLSNENFGVSETRNLGLKNASGEYIMFVDSDDKLSPKAITKMISAAKEKDSDLVIGGYEIDYGNSRMPIHIDSVGLTGKTEIAQYFCVHFLEAIASSVWGKLYKRELINCEFNKDLTMGEDLLFNLGYIKNINSLKAINETVYKYNRTNPNSLVKNYKQGYYEQDKQVCLEWVGWMAEVGVKNRTQIYYHISRSFMTCLLSIVDGDKKAAKDKLFTLIDDDLIFSITQSVHMYNNFQKLMLKCASKKKVELLILLTRVYIKLKNILKGG